MKEDLLKIINRYGVMPQLKYFQSEVFELNEAILQYEHINNFDKQSSNFKTYGNNTMREHIAEEIADVMVMLKQFQMYYGISRDEIRDIMKYKIERQLERIENENK